MFCNHNQNCTRRIWERQQPTNECPLGANFYLLGLLGKSVIFNNLEKAVSDFTWLLHKFRRTSVILPESFEAKTWNLTLYQANRTHEGKLPKTTNRNNLTKLQLLAWLSPGKDEGKTHSALEPYSSGSHRPARLGTGIARAQPPLFPVLSCRTRGELWSQMTQ